MENKKTTIVNISITLSIDYDSAQLTEGEAVEEILQEGDFTVIYQNNNIMEVDTRVNGIIGDIL